MSATPTIELPGAPGDAGRTHGRILGEQLRGPFLDAYLDDMADLKRLSRSDLAAQAARWVGRLPTNFQEEIDGMAMGARVPVAAVGQYLYADIARPGQSDVPVPDGPMCSGVVTPAGSRDWVARNCDWYRRLLRRGTAAVVHRVPGRLPVMALGIFGDIDVDTGVNGAGLWVHVHTMHATDEPRGDRSCISWLFWCREALELCATIDELEAFIEETERDRGTILVALDGKTGDRAIFECAKGGHTRVEPDDAGTLIATNHPQHKQPTDPVRLSRSKRGATTRRYSRLHACVRAEAMPEHGPDDLIELLGDEEVEMRDNGELRTIYASVCDPARKEIWFAAGGFDGTPASSGGAWGRVGWPF